MVENRVRFKKKVTDLFTTFCLLQSKNSLLPLSMHSICGYLILPIHKISFRLHFFPNGQHVKKDSVLTGKKTS